MFQIEKDLVSKPPYRVDFSEGDKGGFRKLGEADFNLGKIIN